MSRIVVLCEGDTEEVAVRHFIARQWKADGHEAVGLVPNRLNPQDVGRYARLKLDDAAVLAVFTLFDLHEMKQVVHQPNDTLESKVVRVRDWLRAQVHHVHAGRFFPHVCVHETEAWVLAEGDALADRLRDSGVKPDPNAELANFQNPPKRRVNQLFLRCLKTRYREIADGTPLFKKMEFKPVYSSCRYFRAFYDDLSRAAENVSPSG